MIKEESCHARLSRILIGLTKIYHFGEKKIIIGMKKFCHAYDNSVCKVPNSSFVKGKLQFCQRKTPVWAKKNCSLNGGKLQFGWGKTESDEGARSPVLCRARAKIKLFYSGTIGPEGVTPRRSCARLSSLHRRRGRRCIRQGRGTPPHPSIR